MEELKKQRSIVKSTITRLFNYCNSSDATDDCIRSRAAKVDEYFQNFESLQNQIELLLESREDLATEELYRTQVENNYYAIKAKSKNNGDDITIIDNSDQNQLSNVVDTLARNQSALGLILERLSNQNTSTPIPQSSSEVISHQSNMRLPRISLPEFDGTYTKWIHFRDLFEALINSRMNLSNIEKFEYLQSQLKGDALSLIKHLNHSSENYIIGWELLKKKYNNSELIKKNYMKLLFDQPTMKGPYVIDLKRLVNTTNECINALTAMNEPTDKWDSVLLFHIERKLDVESQTLWNRSIVGVSSFEKFREFLDKRLRELENCQNNKLQLQQPTYRQRTQSNIHMTAMRVCPVCQQQHLLFNCQKFRALNVNERIQVVRKNNICYNCLQYGHIASDCKGSHCKLCTFKHNTLLHRGDNAMQRPEKLKAVSNETSTIHVNTANTTNHDRLTLLPTAVAMILGADQKYHPCRILLDTGAQATLISESCVQRLKLKRLFDNTVLCGIGGENKNVVRGKVQLTLKSKQNEASITTTALCLRQLTQLQPNYPVFGKELEYFKNLTLADPQCNLPNRIDVLLGANVFNEWCLNQHIVHPSGSPSAMLTIFGWVLIGNVSVNRKCDVTIAHTSMDLCEQLQKFWNIEELHDQRPQYTDDEQAAEDHFQKNIQRDETGRYVVRLPFKSPDHDFGNTRIQSVKRLLNMESKFAKNEQLHNEYKKFMDDYVQLRHMTCIGDSGTPRYILPHHAVIKPSSTTTKLRVVFDGSAKGTNGACLNDHLLIGPTIQNDIFTILLQFRKYQIAASADIEKMYRQVLVHPADRAYQCIVWRPDSKQEICTYQLNTITYGTSAAPFLAIRTLKQIALDSRHENPEVADVIMDNFYVDDVMFSVPDVPTAIKIKSDLCTVLSNAQMHLRKWSSNSNEVLQTTPEYDLEISATTVIDDIQAVKTLGLHWHTSSDTFEYSVSIPEYHQNMTKRLVLSVISKVFDPLGWLAPFVINLKIFMQKLWLRGLEWDAILTDEPCQQWKDIYRDMNDIHIINIPRWLQYSDGVKLELHGFADSSELAYAAVAYLKVIHDDGNVTTRLIASKTRVAPVKQITLPRLELCACHLLTKLLTKVKIALKCENVDTYGWTDSTIVLAWLSDHPRKWKNFIANRTAYIINTLPANHWNHISSGENPADLATRGLTPIQLKNADLWWHGPPILQENTYTTTNANKGHTTDEEKRSKTICHIHETKIENLIYDISDFTTLVRCVARIYRFIRNCKNRRIKQTGFINSLELKHAHNIVIRQLQQMSFSKEINILSSGKQLEGNHKLLPLTPFLDEDGLLRVGGRLVNASIPYDQKHPLILDKDNIVTARIVRYYHLKNLHAGSRQLQYILGLRYWIPSVIHVIKQCVYKCTTCMRYRNKPFEQRMGDMPKYRLQAITAFHNVGVDFAGPLFIRSWKGRGSKQYKCWIAVFVCLVTKAMHLEAVTELTTNAFIATLRRFVARRGKPAHMFSDNGTNFIGCNQRLKELLQFMLTSTTQESITKETAEIGIQWHFTPPSGPNFGGIWEAGVKSVKYHLVRIVGKAAITFEEMSTVLCQIESCLNSRPLTAKFENDVDPLTPAHFLIMRSMQTVPDQDIIDITTNRLTRWQQLQKLVQMFWKKWSNEYLTQLQGRTKWKKKLENLKVDDVVILKDEQSPPSKWSIGKIIQTHPGEDSLVRVVTVKTQKGVYKRPISKLCPLIVDC